MKDVEAYTKKLRISARKLNKVAKIFKGRKDKEALESLRYVPKKAAIPLAKTLKSAIANAENNFGMKEEKLTIKDIFVEQGPTLKRFRAGSRGTARPILKRTSNLKIVLEEK